MKLKMNSNAGCGKPATAGYLHLNVSPLNPMLIFLQLIIIYIEYVCELLSY